jgi:hypothetical protein
MKIRKNGKVINLTESDLRRITKRVILSEGASELLKFNDGEDTIKSRDGWVWVNGDLACIKASKYALGVSNLWKNKQGGLTIQLNDPEGDFEGHNPIKLSKKDVDKLFSDIKSKGVYKTKLAGYDVSLKRGDSRVNWCKRQWS